MALIVPSLKSRHANLVNPPSVLRRVQKSIDELFTTLILLVQTVISDSESSGTERNPIDELTLGDNATISHAPVSSTKTVAALNHATSSSPEEFMTLRRNFAFSNWVSSFGRPCTGLHESPLGCTFR